MRRQLAVLLLGAVLVPHLSSAQTITPGTRVRVTQPGEGIRIGTVVALTADTLEVRFAGRSDPAHLSLAQLTRLDMSRGKEHRTLGRAALGVVVGAAVGSLIGAASASNCPTSAGVCPSARGNMILDGGTFFGALGGVVGLIAGRRPSEKWEQVAPLTAASHPSRAGHTVPIPSSTLRLRR